MEASGNDKDPSGTLEKFQNALDAPEKWKYHSLPNLFSSLSMKINPLIGLVCWYEILSLCH